LSNGGVFLGNYTVVAGDLTAAGTVERQAGSRVLGELLRGQPPNPELPQVQLALSWAQVAPTRTEVSNGQMARLPPGRYAQLVVRGNGEVVLSCGDYSINELLLESDSRLRFDSSGCETRIFVRDELTMRARWLSAAPEHVLVVYAGSRDVHVTVPVTGTILAPSARVTLAQPAGSGLTGAVLAREVQLQGGARVVYAPFTGEWPF
jgi:hypothetical protein